MAPCIRGSSISAIALGVVFAHVALSAASAVVAPGVQVRARDSEETAATLRALQYGETARAWVFFTDKGVFDSEIATRKFQTIAGALDPRVAERRSRTVGPLLVDFHDLPIAPAYAATVAELGADVIRRSFWLNAVSVDASASELAVLADEPYVQCVVLVRDIALAEGTSVSEDVWIATVEAGDNASTLEIPLPATVPPGSPVETVFAIARARGLFVDEETGNGVFRGALESSPRAVPSEEPALFAAASLTDVPATVVPEPAPLPAADPRAAFVAPPAPLTPTLFLASQPGKARVRFTYVVPSHFAGRPRVEIVTPAGAVVRSYEVISGTASLTWDGRDGQGREVDPGEYGVRLRAEDWIATGRVRIRG